MADDGKNPNPLNLPPLKSKRGRPKAIRPTHTFDQKMLVDEWINSPLTDAREFLAPKGYSMGDLVVRQFADRLETEYPKKQYKETEVLSPEVDKAVDIKTRTAKRALINEPGPDDTDPQTEDKITELWRKITTWRNNQPEADYKIGNALQNHIKMILNQSLVNVEGEMRTKLNARAISHLTQASLNVQKLQRLALGLSTENMGLQERDNLVAETSDDEIPTFVVEINKDGKFIRPRPRQVSRKANQ